MLQSINLKVGTEREGPNKREGEERDAKSSNARLLLKLKNALYHREHVLHPSGNIQRRVFVSRESKPFGSPLGNSSEFGIEICKICIKQLSGFCTELLDKNC